MSDEVVTNGESHFEPVTVERSDLEFIVKAKVAYDEKLVELARRQLVLDQAEVEAAEFLQKHREQIAETKASIREAEKNLTQVVKIVASKYGVNETDATFDVARGHFFKPNGSN